MSDKYISDEEALGPDYNERPAHDDLMCVISDIVGIAGRMEKESKKVGDWAKDRQIVALESKISHLEYVIRRMGKQLDDEGYIECPDCGYWAHESKFDHDLDCCACCAENR